MLRSVVARSLVSRLVRLVRLVRFVRLARPLAGPLRALALVAPLGLATACVVPPAATGPYGAAPAATSGHGAAAGSGVFVNGVELTVADAQAVGLPPGAYWYDPSTGHWGPVGEGPAGQGAGAPADGFWSSGASDSRGNESNGAGYVCIDGACTTYGM